MNHEALSRSKHFLAGTADEARFSVVNFLVTEECVDVGVALGAEAAVEALGVRPPHVCDKAPVLREVSRADGADGRHVYAVGGLGADSWGEGLRVQPFMNRQACLRGEASLTAAADKGLSAGMLRCLATDVSVIFGLAGDDGSIVRPLVVSKAPLRGEDTPTSAAYEKFPIGVRLLVK